MSKTTTIMTSQRRKKKSFCGQREFLSMIHQLMYKSQEKKLAINVLRQEFIAAPRQTKEPANKKIEPQRSLFSTRKTTLKKSRSFEKPSQDEQNSIAVALLQKDASN
ncbi:uncharacterized protein LOC117181510 [Belonocnema kinseyi]|uniref:uncharacterized protein LOC117181510 n=1 Tax=Belonocnema kinseyi TaxID=2817044 RepID=UPI00143DA61D|nr:uncharacterized protein LOC117181510 [Belonocnema kinseyi]